MDNAGNVSALSKITISTMDRITTTDRTHSFEAAKNKLDEHSNYLLVGVPGSAQDGNGELRNVGLSSQTLNAGDGDDSLVFSHFFSNVTITKTMTLNMGLGNDYLDINDYIRGGTGPSGLTTVNMGDGDDLMIVRGEKSYINNVISYQSQINLGTGNDVFKLLKGSIYDVNTTSINGGSGNDLLSLGEVGSSGTVNFGQITGFETINLNDKGTHLKNVTWSNVINNASEGHALYIQGGSNTEISLGNRDSKTSNTVGSKQLDENNSIWTAIKEAVGVDGNNYVVWHNSQATNDLQDLWIQSSITTIL